jgi:hypothetical protein
VPQRGGFPCGYRCLWPAPQLGVEAVEKRPDTVGQPPSTEIGVLNISSLKAKKLSKLPPRKSTSRTLKGVDQQYPPVKWSSLKVSRNTPLWCTPTQYRYLSHKNPSLSPSGHCTA